MPIKNIVLAISLILTSMSSTASTKVFDTVTWFKVSASGTNSHIQGIEKNTGSFITASFQGTGLQEGKSVGSICTPLVLTVIEKPGRYYLHVTMNSINQLEACMLELKSQPG